MKRAFDKAGVSSANWRVITDKGIDKRNCKRVGTPIIIKPAVSGGSMGVSVKNVVFTEEELTERVEEIKKDTGAGIYWQMDYLLNNLLQAPSSPLL